MSRITSLRILMLAMIVTAPVFVHCAYVHERGWAQDYDGIGWWYRPGGALDPPRVEPPEGFRYDPRPRAPATAAASAAGPGDMLCVTDSYQASGLHVKAEPRNSANTVMVVGSGRVLVVFSPQGDWLHVGISRAAGLDGYVPKAAVQRTDLDGLPCGS